MVTSRTAGVRWSVVAKAKGAMTARPRPVTAKPTIATAGAGASTTRASPSAPTTPAARTTGTEPDAAHRQVGEGPRHQ